MGQRQVGASSLGVHRCGYARRPLRGRTGPRNPEIVAGFAGIRRRGMRIGSSRLTTTEPPRFAPPARHASLAPRPPGQNAGRETIPPRHDRAAARRTRARRAGGPSSS